MSKDNLIRTQLLKSTISILKATQDTVFKTATANIAKSEEYRRQLAILVDLANYEYLIIKKISQFEFDPDTVLGQLEFEIKSQIDLIVYATKNL
jgi:hypothetical protein